MGQVLFEDLPLDEFLVRWADEIGDPGSELCLECTQFRLPKQGKCTAFLFAGGLVRLDYGKDLHAAYETLQRVEDRRYYSDWAEFCRGVWSSNPPHKGGTWPTRDLNGFRGRDRVFVKVEGKLTDVTPSGGFTPKGKLTEWRGEFWSMPYPRLKGAW